MRIELRSIGRRYGGVKAIDDLNLTFDGGLNAVIGLNGAGKSTLMRLLSGLIAPTQGEMTIDGEPMQRDSVEFRRRIGLLLDYPAIFPDHSPIDHVALALRLYRAEPDTSRVMDVFERMDLIPLAQRPAVTLSRGQSYKAALAALILADPEVWLLDEPFASGMDPRGLSCLREEVHAAVARGRIVIYTTQILEVVQRFCDRLLVIDRGRLAWSVERSELESLPVNGAGSLEERLCSFREAGS